MTKCTTDAAANSVIAQVNYTDDLYGKTQLTINSTGDVVAREFWHHYLCLREITRQKMKKMKKIKKNMMLMNSDSNALNH